MDGRDQPAKPLGELGAPVRAGDVVAEKYEVERVLGSGGMGVVVAAKHLALGHRVALKLLRDEDPVRPEARVRFHREAQAAAKLRGEHVARIHDVLALPSGAPVLVMEHLVGRDLAEVLRTEGALSIERAVACVLQACDAIAEAHAMALVHRDLKPSNLFLVDTPDGAPKVKVLDFGISKSLAADGAEGDLTSSQGVLGSPQYMSPEQVRASKKLDERTDVWSLGAVLFELLAGKPPFRGPTVSAELAPFAAARDRPLVSRITATLRPAGSATLEPSPRDVATPDANATGTDWGKTNAGHEASRSRTTRRKLVALTAFAALVAVGASLALREMLREAPATSAPASSPSDLSPAVAASSSTSASPASDAASVASLASSAPPAVASSRRIAVPRAAAPKTAAPPGRTEF